MSNASNPAAGEHTLNNKSKSYDVVVLGGGAAGLMCATTAGARDKRVLVIEKANKLGKKILMSGGGRCNFTNLDVQPEHYICPNPHFVKSALSQYTQWDFIELVRKHDIPYHEKKHGQLFCDDSAKDILDMLVRECEQAGVEFVLDCETSAIDYKSEYQITTTKLGSITASSLVLATGGLSIPTLGGSGYAYQYAEERGLTVNKTEAALVPFTLTGKWHQLSNALAGASLPIVASVPSQQFSEDMLFTHRGISGPAILQLSNYWHIGEAITINLLPSIDCADFLIQHKNHHPNTKVSKILAEHLPRSVAQQFIELFQPELAKKTLQETKNNELAALGHLVNDWQLTPSGTEGYRTAEVTRGGIDVSAVSSKTMRANLGSHSNQENLFIIGEALDVTGHLGGFNFQWAWSSGYVAGQSL